MYINNTSCSCCNPIFSQFLLELLRRKFLEGTKALSKVVMRSNLEPAKIQGDATISKGIDNPAPTLTNAGIQDISTTPNPDIGKATIYRAKKIITMEAAQPEVNTTKKAGEKVHAAVAVEGDTILAVGTFEEVKKTLRELGKPTNKINDTFIEKVILPGFVEHHLHPLLGAMSLAVEVISIEEWELPGKLFKAASDEKGYKDALAKALKEMEKQPKTPNEETLFTWGYHQYFHSSNPLKPLYRKELDDLYLETFPDRETEDPKNYRPIVIWHRSCHEFIFNTAALNKYEITEELIEKADELTKAQADFENGHFFETGMEVILGQIAEDFLSEERVKYGVDMLRKYLLSKGVTTICEPGTQMNKDLQEVWNASLSDSSAAFRTYFTPDGRVLYDTHKKNNNLGMLIPNTESWLNIGKGKVKWLPKQIKLFADGAIFSQLMQLEDSFLDGHQGQWIQEPEDYKAAFKLYWEAGYQISTHVNGDKGLRVVVETLAENMKTFPRKDHRFTVVHFAVSTEEQVKKLAEMGAIITANPYYVNALADNYSANGLGPSRADNMVRLGSVAREGMILSLHSDMPMAPADPLFLAWCAAERPNIKETRVVAKNQKISIERALSAVTIESAYCLSLEDEIGSIKPGKKANLTILEADPMNAKPYQPELGDPDYTVMVQRTNQTLQLKDIPIWGCVFEGQMYQAKVEQKVQDAQINFDHKRANLMDLATIRG